MNIKNLLVLVAGLGIANIAWADSVHEWGHWNAEDDAVAAILAGADPAEVTEPTAAGPGGSVGQPINPVALDHPVVGQGGIPSLVQNISAPSTPYDAVTSVSASVAGQIGATHEANTGVVVNNPGVTDPGSRPITRTRRP